MDERTLVAVAVVGMLKDAIIAPDDPQSWGDQITGSLGLTDTKITGDIVKSLIPHIAQVHGLLDGKGEVPDGLAAALFHCFNEGARLRTAIDNAKKETAA